MTSQRNKKQEHKNEKLRGSHWIMDPTTGGKCKTWTLDWTGLVDWTHGLDCGLRFGLDFGLICSSMTTISNKVLH